MLWEKKALSLKIGTKYILEYVFEFKLIYFMEIPNTSYSFNGKMYFLTIMENSRKLNHINICRKHLAC